MERVLKPRLVVVAGGRSEVAIATARICADEATTTVLITTRSSAPESWRHLSEKVVPLPNTDLTNQADLDRLSATVDRLSQMVDEVNLVSCVGVFPGFAPLGGLDLAEAKLQLQSNLLAAHGSFMACLPSMSRLRSGSAIFLGSHAAQGQFPLMGMFLAAKAGLESYVRTAASEYSPLGIRAICVAPATIDTPQERALRPGADTSRWVRPDGLGHLIASLLSENLALINGSTLQVFEGSMSYHATGFLERIGPARALYPRPQESSDTDQ